MTTQVRVGGAWKEITGGSIRVSGSWRRLQAIKVYSDAAWRTVATFASPLSLSLSSSTASKTGTLSTVTTGAVIATPTGGQGPFTYAWVKQSGGTINATAASSASSGFRATGMAIDETRTAVFRCTCTDAFGASDAEDVSVTLTRRESQIIGGQQ